MGDVISFTAFYTRDLRDTIGSLSDKALRVYVLIATYADRGGMCYPGIAELSERGNKRVESIMDGLDELERLGLIGYARRNERDPITGRNIPNVYLVSGCLVRATDSAFVPLSKHEPDSAFKHDSQTTNSKGITNANNQESKNQFQAPPPSNQGLLTEKAAGGGDDYATPPKKPRTRTKTKAKDSSAAGTAPQNSKAPLPPYPPLPAGFDPDAEMPDQDSEQAARWLCAEAITRRDGGDYTAALSMANARRYIARFDRWRVRAALTLSRRDPATKSMVGRMDYLLRTSVAAEAEQLQNEMNRLNDLDQAGD